MPETKNKTKCPVCGMDVDVKNELKSEHKGHSYYFCSDDDKKKFQKSPDKFTKATKAA